MEILLFDGPQWETLLPISYTRPISELKLGYFSIKEKWERLSGAKVLINCRKELSSSYKSTEKHSGLFINASFLPSKPLWEKISQLKDGEAISSKGEMIAFCSDKTIGIDDIQPEKNLEVDIELKQLNYYWDIFKALDDAIHLDFELLGASTHPSSELHAAEIIGDDLFISEGVDISGAIINTKTGPVILGKGAQVMEGVSIRGPLVLGDHSVLKMGAKIYGASSFGPHCKVGGEVSNSFIQGYSNKGHDGFLGNSVIGAWCNFGADTNVSNLKNNYSNVKVWDYKTEGYIDSGEQFCGLCMGDHAKTGINTMLNTGTVIGVSANVFGSGFPPKFIPSFSWGGEKVEYDLEKALDTARRVMSRRNIELSKADTDILSHIKKKEGHFFS